MEQHAIQDIQDEVEFIKLDKESYKEYAYSMEQRMDDILLSDNTMNKEVIERHVSEYQKQMIQYKV